jgi:hypothetical protein
MATESLDTPEKVTWQHVKFTDASSGAVLAAFTDRDSDDTFEGVDYTSEPAMEVRLSVMDGMLSSDNPTKITLPATPINAESAAQTFLDRVSSGLPYPTVAVEIAETTIADPYPKSVLKSFQGELEIVDVNNKDDRDILEFEALSDKQKLQEVKLGEPCNLQCINWLGDSRCQVNLSTFTHTLTISDIDGKVVTISSGVPNSLGDGYFRAGYMEIGTLRIRIHNWRDEVEGDKTKFFMQERPTTGTVRL